MRLNLANVMISKKLPITIASIAIFAAVLTGASAYIAASNSAHEEGKEHLLETAKSKADLVKGYFEDAGKQVTELATSNHVSNALDRFSAAYNEIGPDAENILQNEYIDSNPNPLGQKEKFDVGNSGSNYDAVHASLHPWLRTIAKTNDYYDIFLFDAQGRNVYTVYKERDFATQLVNGKWKDSGLGELVRKTLQNKDGKPLLEDFLPYAPSNGIPAGFIAAPIKDANGNIKGIVAIQLSIDKLDKAMTTVPTNGKTGENIIVGEDKLMRNNSPHSKESTLLKKKFDSPEIVETFKGESGTNASKNLEGKNNILAHTPLEVMGAKYAIISDITKAELEAPLNKLAIITAIVAAIIGAFSAFIGFWFSKTITNPVGDLTDAMRILSNGDTSKSIPGTERGDELGTMAKAVEVFRDNAIERTKLEAMSKEEQLRQIKRGETISEATANFERVAGDMLRAVSAASAELNSTAQAMTAAAQRTNEMASSVAAAAEESTVNASTASGSATELSSAIAQIQASSSESASIATEAVGISTEAQNAVTELVGAAQSISEVVNLIRGIAEQTNLLALNATIEAARAGEAGAGFAIVAQEVKNLANQTAGATDDISNHIGSIQTVVDGARDAMNRIAEVIGRINGISGEIGHAVEAQSVVTDEIARNVAEVAVAAKSVTEDVIKVTENASETGVAASQVLSASHELSMQAAKLEQETNEFLARVRAA